VVVAAVGDHTDGPPPRPTDTTSDRRHLVEQRRAAG
jgi:hypothetical protein